MTMYRREHAGRASGTSGKVGRERQECAVVPLVAIPRLPVLRAPKLPIAAERVETSGDETPTYSEFPTHHRRLLLTNNPRERIIRAITRNTRLVGPLPDSGPVLILRTVRLRDIASTKWGRRRVPNATPVARKRSTPAQRPGLRVGSEREAQLTRSRAPGTDLAFVSPYCRSPSRAGRCPDTEGFQRCDWHQSRTATR
jgi:hypothetical protein